MFVILSRTCGHVRFAIVALEMLDTLKLHTFPRHALFLNRSSWPYISRHVKFTAANLLLAIWRPLKRTGVTPVVCSQTHHRDGKNKKCFCIALLSVVSFLWKGLVKMKNCRYFNLPHKQFYIGYFIIRNVEVFKSHSSLFSIWLKLTTKIWTDFRIGLNKNGIQVQWKCKSILWRWVGVLMLS